MTKDSENPYAPPSSSLQDSNAPTKPSVWWKVFFWAHLVLSILSLLMLPIIELLTPYDYIDMAFSFAIIPGLYGFSFCKRIGSLSLWRWIFYLVVVEAIVFVVVLPLMGVPTYGEDGVDAWIMIDFAYSALVFRALYRYAYRQPYVWNHPSRRS